MKIELSHDFIAKKIYEEASIEDKARARATKFLHERHTHYLSSKTLLLTKRDLIYIHPYINQMDLSKEELLYINRSQKTIKRGKLMARFKDAAIVALICGIVFSSWGLWERNRFWDVSKDLASAQDSIDVLLRQGTMDNNTPINDGLYKNKLNVYAEFFTTIKLSGTVRTEQDQPIENALVEIMGATAYTKEDGSYQMHLVLPPKHIGENVVLTISKTNYLSISKSVDIDQTEVNLAIKMMRK